VTATLRHTALAILSALLLFLPACAETRATHDPRPTADCPVCSTTADLACLVVHIDDATPRATYRGQTYYFCSEDCRIKFEKHPEKYAGK
jgi:YHS domain-containing protein